MPRFLLVAVSVIAGILPVSAFALALGEINLKSALNQPFLAEIPVSSASADELTGLKVSLASAERYERFGLLLPGFLRDFEFKLVSERGRNLIRVRSSQPVVEPFVTMLLEIEWPQGRLLREYTVLLDPPAFATPAPVAAAPAARPQRPVSEPPRVARRPEAVPAGSQAGEDGEDYGPVQRNDTLWRIAERVRPDGSVNMNQVMLAIYRANPEAFSGNINRLRAGAILRIPTSDEMRRISRSEALAEVRQQNEDWRGGRVATASGGEQAARLRLVPPAGETGEAAAGREQAGAAQRAAADADLRARVEVLEAELEQRERLLELRESELRDLQNQLAALRAREAERTGEAPVIDAAPVPDEAAETTAPETAAEAAAETPVDGGVAPATEGPDTAAPRTSGMPPVVSSTPAAPEPSLVRQLFGSVWLYLGIGVALLAALFVARSRRQAAGPADDWDELLEEPEAVAVSDTEALTPPPRQAADETFVVEEGPPASDTDQSVRVGSGTLEMDRSGDQETPLEKTLSSDAGLNLDQADPIAEAEFHMAYGLYDQAADLLQAAIRAEPERRDLRRKLIDVYFVWENRGGFLREAQAFRDMVGDSDAEWNKVLIMGKQLCPDEELFAASPTSVAGDEAMDLALEESHAAAGVDLPLGDDDAGLDFDLGGEQEEAAAEGLDFDLGEGAAEAPDTSPTVEDAGGSPTMETPTIEAPGLDSGESPTVETPTIESPQIEPTMETPTIETPAGELMEQADRGDETAALDLDELGLDLEDFAEVASDLESENGEPDIADDDATLLAGTEEAGPLLDEMRQGLDATAEVEKLDLDIGGGDELAGSDLDSEATGELPSLGIGDDDEAGLEALTAALEKSRGPAASEDSDKPAGGDTVEQPRPQVEDTAEQPRPAGTPDSEATAELLAATPDLGAVDLEIGGDLPPDDTPTGTMDAPSERPEGPTMTEVGTKLDLARAYIDMGDPDGARSILDEVIEEGDEAQRQEAQQMLDQLPR